ncbi:hypothetical protein ACLKA7_005567 [Drosophila subpalustris]
MPQSSPRRNRDEDPPNPHLVENVAKNSYDQRRGAQSLSFLFKISVPSISMMVHEGYDAIYKLLKDDVLKQPQHWQVPASTRDRSNCRDLSDNHSSVVQQALHSATREAVVSHINQHRATSAASRLR